MRVICGDCLTWLKQQPDDSVDLVLTSPPYEAARTYGIGFKLTGQAWVDYCFDRYIECCRISRGLVCWVVEGQTKQFRYSCTPMRLITKLDDAGICLRKPPAFHRFGVPGSGGNDWLRNDYELCVCASKGKLPWSDPTATGQPPKYQPGGDMSNRMPNGRRVMKLHTKNEANGKRLQGYNPPKLANPGNVIKCNVGGGRMGSMLCHDNEAPFPEALAAFFIRSFCPPGGVVLDPFCGSGTTLAVALLHGREGVGVDVRASQCDLTRRRIAEARQRLLPPTKERKRA